MSDSEWIRREAPTGLRLSRARFRMLAADIRLRIGDMSYAGNGTGYRAAAESKSSLLGTFPSRITSRVSETDTLSDAARRVGDCAVLNFSVTALSFLSRWSVWMHFRIAHTANQHSCQDQNYQRHQLLAPGFFRLEEHVLRRAVRERRELVAEEPSVR